MALSLRDVRCDAIASRALAELMHDYTVAEEEGRLVLTKNAGTMRLFLHALDDGHERFPVRHEPRLCYSNAETGLVVRLVTIAFRCLDFAPAKPGCYGVWRRRKRRRRGSTRSARALDSSTTSFTTCIIV